MIQKNPPQNQMQIDFPEEGKRKYKLNKKKFVKALAIIGCIVGAAVILSGHIFSNLQTSSVFSYADISQNAFFAAANNSVNSTSQDFTILDGKSIVIDAGHGGFDPGAIGVSGVYESDLNLAVATYLQQQLEAYGAQVIMTRADDDALAETKSLDMAERREIISESGSDIVISIHMNSHTDSDTSGPLVLFMEGSVQGENLATAIQESLNEYLDPKNIGSARADDLYILRSGYQPCVLIECGYLSNIEEEEKLQDSQYQQLIANAICEGVAQYFSNFEQQTE